MTIVLFSVALLSGKISILSSRKTFDANFFRSFFDPNIFSTKLWQSSAFFDFVNLLWISYYGIWEKNKLSIILSISKIVWNLEYFCNSLYAFPFAFLIIAFDDDVIGCIKKSDLNLNFVSEGTFPGLFARKIEVSKFFRINIIGREKQLA